MMITHTAKIFMNGRSQAVRLPKEYRFNCDEVYVRRQGEEVVISPKQSSWDDFFNQTSAFGDDFLNQRDDEQPQERDFF